MKSSVCFGGKISFILPTQLIEFTLNRLSHQRMDSGVWVCWRRRGAVGIMWLRFPDIFKDQLSFRAVYRVSLGSVTDSVKLFRQFSVALYPTFQCLYGSSWGTMGIVHQGKFSLAIGAYRCIGQFVVLIFHFLSFSTIIMSQNYKKKLVFASFFRGKRASISFIFTHFASLSLIKLQSHSLPFSDVVNL